ncbi:MAG: hypothetical protein R2828_10825 [Saprospiraceae bacterium]
MIFKTGQWLTFMLALFSDINLKFLLLLLLRGFLFGFGARYAGLGTSMDVICRFPNFTCIFINWTFDIRCFEGGNRTASGS